MSSAPPALLPCAPLLWPPAPSSCSFSCCTRGASPGLSCHPQVGHRAAGTLPGSPCTLQAGPCPDWLLSLRAAASPVHLLRTLLLALRPLSLWGLAEFTWAWCPVVVPFLGTLSGCSVTHLILVPRSLNGSKSAGLRCSLKPTGCVLEPACSRCPINAADCTRA